jgi:Zn finger protein HypA/HybF involved in hydrogenase expression
MQTEDYVTRYAVRCPKCKHVSHKQDDINNGYCENCQKKVVDIIKEMEEGQQETSE